ncbi:MAG: RtcB family protein [Candidatus Omnitrophica bacterium]|nr:RtcB family protein [Candidatus Omnitrophota bacterium]MBU1128325.1 RtcB family protein [Candidatus Omnitrophota bacterium]MBU1657304.1 RtcB family protein [Candidatus Omnitrophota bacterium]MBU1784581.1 RtcB family protein [Candidatus Omnitrophota bacterium]MBU1851757.1 RtcB family protein [Candidatus Omnitrophota bacterium]
MAKKVTKHRDIARELQQKGIIVRYTGRNTLHEEVSDAYKDISDVVDVALGAGISEKVARMRPLGVIKG